MSVNWQTIAFDFFGGLGLFLFSIKYMGDGLQQAAGDRLRDYIDKYTSNPFLGVLIGIVFTGLIQSSSGVTAITVGLVSAGLLTLRQAIGIVMGANIGTTVTSFLIGFKLGDYGLPILFIGAVLFLFIKNRKINNLGKILFGLGGLFFALHLMGDAMMPLREIQAFRDYMVTLGDNPLQGVLLGTGLTVLIQSSSATIGILQSLYAGGLLDLNGALPILFGDNIGTTITAVLAALSGNISAKRVAGAHVMFNVVGTLVCVMLLAPFTSLVAWFQASLGLTPEMTIAFAHGTFNITNTVVQFPFIGLLAYIVTKIIPGEDEVIRYDAIYLDKLLITQSPSIALGNARKELVHLSAYAIQSFEAAFRYIMTADEKYVEKVNKYEMVVNSIDEELTHYLIQLSNETLSENENEILASILDSSRDLERIGDHAVNLTNLSSYNFSKHITFSPDAIQELEDLYKMTHGMILDASRVIADHDVELAKELQERHKEVQRFERQIRKAHIKRMNMGICTPLAGINFIDLITPCTRITDHALNLSDKVLENQL
ncbi:Na/Pi cotransporter family protein [Streptococcus zalophi]|uniref:Na/Pi cotransporter family protein n=1 Tax=Streptococcus zalophi TaxID=640031 RepID=A0A934UD22_9STRE|nr:Na/Pi cotransporter family protein [Streptococcus zalophi]MBJ8349233.1 Na/Pi cotransporter family protein [Streptococcus zalophi]MCR8967144.1 Na/Pi cotransporter family protein [Streptococcus zalophi]